LSGLEGLVEDNFVEDNLVEDSLPALEGNSWFQGNSEVGCEEGLVEDNFVEDNFVEDNLVEDNLSGLEGNSAHSEEEW